VACGVSRRAGSFAGGIDFPDCADVLGGVVVEFGHRGHTETRPADKARPETRATQVVSRLSNGRCGNESLVTQRVNGVGPASSPPRECDFKLSDDMLVCCPVSRWLDLPAA